MAVLQVFQAKLLRSLDGSALEHEAVKDPCSATDLALRTTRTTAQLIGRSMASLVVLERHLWLILAEISPSVTGFAVCKSSQAMRHYLPKRSSASGRPKNARPLRLSRHLSARYSILLSENRDALSMRCLLRPPGGSGGARVQSSVQPPWRTHTGSRVEPLLEKLSGLHRRHDLNSCVFSSVFQNSCIRSKLRDFLYVTENLPESCREKVRVRFLKRRVQILYSIISRACYRDLVFFTDDCESLETGNIRPRYTEDRLQPLIELD